MSDAIIFDVAHGNCALIRSNGEFAVVDAPTGSLLMNTLEDLGVKEVEVALVSHTDKDHIAGVLSLLTSETITLKKLYLNPDSQKTSQIWRCFRAAVAVAERKGTCDVIPALSTTLPGELQVGEASILVKGPSASFALAGVGAVDLSGRTISSNSISAVVKICHSRTHDDGVLLAGDIDDIGLDNIIQNGQNLSAATLVYPHHGGLPGSSNADDFTTKLLQQVKPKDVIFSHGRDKHNNPRPDIVSSVLSQGCSVACTQLSKSCNAAAIYQDLHLEEFRAKGRTNGISCAGSISIALSSNRRCPTYAYLHGKFIKENVSSPMCRKH